MVFFVLLLVNATLFLRPTEVFPDLSDLPLYGVLMTACCLGALRQMKSQLRWRELSGHPITLCVLGLLAAIVMSHLTHMFIRGAQEAGITFLKTVLYYLAVVGLVNTPRRFRQFLVTVTVSATLMVTLCVVDYLEIVDFSFITHYSEWDETPGNEDEGWRRTLRMRGTGLFQDPNDISMVIVAASVLCGYFMLDKRKGARRWLWLAPMSSMVVGLFCTQSRGGLMAAGGAGLTYVALKFGRTAAIAAALAGVCGLSLIGGRQGNVDISDGTGQDRIQLWGEGLAELKSANILFGIGMNRYSDIAGLVAHNSFVHAYVELGFFGGSLFFGCVFFSGLGLYRMSNALTPDIDRELVRFHPFAAALLAGWTFSMLGLSRCYVTPTYLVFGLVTAYLNLVQRQLRPQRLLASWDRPHVLRLVASSGALLVGLFVFVRLFAKWG